MRVRRQHIIAARLYAPAASGSPRGWPRAVTNKGVRCARGRRSSVSLVSSTPGQHGDDLQTVDIGRFGVYTLTGNGPALKPLRSTS